MTHARSSALIAEAGDPEGAQREAAFLLGVCDWTRPAADLLGDPRVAEAVASVRRRVDYHPAGRRQVSTVATAAAR
ncbi:MAG: hypothetical protein ACRCW4_14190 [Candidatus Neomicrothrix subdominans]